MVAANGYRDVVALRAQQYIPSVDEINDSGSRRSAAPRPFDGKPAE